MVPTAHHERHARVRDQCRQRIFKNRHNSSPTGLRPGADRGIYCPARGAPRCCSSVVEHSLGKGEVDSSILSSSTIPFKGLSGRYSRHSEIWDYPLGSNGVNGPW